MKFEACHAVALVMTIALAVGCPGQAANEARPPTQRILQANGIGDHADDSPALQAAIDKLPAGGGTVTLAPRTYVITRPLSLPSHLQLIGRVGPAGELPVLRLAAGRNATVLQNANPTTGNTGLRLANFKIDGNRLAQDGSQQMGLYFYRVRDTTLENVTIAHCAGSGAWLRYSSHNTFRGCHFSHNGHSKTFPVCGLNLNDYCDDNTIEGGSFNDNNGGHADYDGNGIRVGDFCQKNAIRGVVANANGRRGLKIQGRLSTVVGNTLDGNTAHSLLVGGVRCDGNVLEGNTVRGTANHACVHVSGGYGATTFQNTFRNNTLIGGLGGIQVFDGAQSCTIVGNRIADTRAHGIWVDGSSDNQIEGNTITNSASNGIHITLRGTRPAARNVVSHNVCGDTRPEGAKTQAYGLFTAIGVGLTTVTGNDLRGNAIAGLSLAGGPNTLEGNTP